MLRKEISPESRNGEQTKGESGCTSLSQQDDNRPTKRARLMSLSDVMFQELPNELLFCILVKVVAMEVKGMKLAKRVWKEKAELVISRIGDVCSRWNSIVTTNFFRNQLNIALEAVEAIRMEIIHQSPLVPPSKDVCPYLITLKDKLFLFGDASDDDPGFFEGPEYFNCYVYSRNNMAEVTQVIRVTGAFPMSTAACSALNCLYLLVYIDLDHIAIYRITLLEVEHEFTISPMIRDEPLWVPTTVNVRVFATANGSLIFINQERDGRLVVIKFCDANGCWQHEMRLSTDDYGFYQAIQKSNGNLILASEGFERKCRLTEIDMNGTVLREYQSSLRGYRCVFNADAYGRILIATRLNEMELLDSEFNLMDFTGPQLDEDRFVCGGRIDIGKMHYNDYRNEVVAVVEDDAGDDAFDDAGIIIVFRFSEE